MKTVDEFLVGNDEEELYCCRECWCCEFFFECASSELSEDILNLE